VCVYVYVCVCAYVCACVCVCVQGIIRDLNRQLQDFTSLTHYETELERRCVRVFFFFFKIFFCFCLCAFFHISLSSFLFFCVVRVLVVRACVRICMPYTSFLSVCDLRTNYVLCMCMCQ
jgi:hypothetical protein